MTWEQFENKPVLSTKITDETLNKYWNHFLHEYDMHSFTESNREMIQVKVKNIDDLKQYVDMMCVSSPGLKKSYTLQGKVAEYAFAYALNSLFHFFGLNRKLTINMDSYIYGGDGGADFFVGNSLIDVKYRDESPNHGLYLDKSFVERNDKNNIIVHTTNTINIKINDLYGYKNQATLIALNGWTTINDFSKLAEDKKGDRWRMDNGFLPIKKLMHLLLREQISFEKNIK